MRYPIKLCAFALYQGNISDMNRIKEILESKGISQTELANLLGISLIWLICMQPTKYNHQYQSCIRLLKY